MFIIPSLVPRPFPPPVFDCSQYANTGGGGGGLEELIMCGDIRQTHGGQYPMKALKALSCNVHLRAGGQSVCKAASILFIVHNARQGWVNMKQGLSLSLLSLPK